VAERTTENAALPDPRQRAAPDVKTEDDGSVSIVVSADDQLRQLMPVNRTLDSVHYPVVDIIDGQNPPSVQRDRSDSLCEAEGVVAQGRRRLLCRLIGQRSR
jgi:hypothetical protein